MWLATVAESIVIIGSLQDPSRLSTNTLSVVLDTLGPAKASKLTAPFVLGAFLVTAGGIIRVQCYRTLGPHFTFVQCIRKEHKLVTTGPYAVVRHPGYASLLMCFVGSCVVFGGPESWVRASGVLGVRWIRVVAAGWCLLKVAGFVTLFRRSTEEDQFLSERFGKEWEHWARRVKYKLVPFIY
ncbi:hypothetical protein J3R82DRAFT_11209 [Butyriboletus roseoflavus]|nr:hypothetical protein J3R82DRAFT_11209 [Butyriboletus roseoflavus]